MHTGDVCDQHIHTTGCMQKFFNRIPELLHDFSADPSKIVTTGPRIFKGSWGYAFPKHFKLEAPQTG